MSRGDYSPTNLSRDLSVGIGRDGEVDLVNVKTVEKHQITNDGHRKNEAMVSWNYVAWTDQSRQIEIHDNSSNPRVRFSDDIFLMNLDTGERQRITEAPAKRFGLQIDWRYLVWQEIRNDETGYDIYAYDIEADEEIPLAVTPGAQQSPTANRGKVVWIDNRSNLHMGNSKSGCHNCPDNQFDIYLYNFITGEEKMIAESAASDYYALDIHCDHIVWRGYDQDNHTAVYLHDLASGQRRVIASPNLGSADSPLVSDNFVVWTVGWPCDVVSNIMPEHTGVYAYDLRTGKTGQLSNYVEPQIYLDGNTLLIHEGCYLPGRVYAVFLE